MNGIGIGLNPTTIRLLIDNFGLIKQIKLTGLIFTDDKHVLNSITHTYQYKLLIQVKDKLLLFRTVLKLVQFAI